MQGNTVSGGGLRGHLAGSALYVGWIALRMRGMRTELETVRELVEERDARGRWRGSE